MFNTIINYSKTLNLNTVFSADRAQCHELKPLLIWQEKAYKGEITERQFEHCINTKISFGKLTDNFSSNDAYRHAIYVIRKLMLYEYGAMQDIALMCIHLAHATSLIDHEKRQTSTAQLKITWRPVFAPIVDNIKKIDAANFYILWIENQGKINEKTLKKFQQKAKQKDQEELLFLLKCFTTKSIPNNCPNHLFVAWPLYHIPLIENISDPIALQFYKKWTKGESLKKQLPTYSKLAQSNAVLREILQHYLHGAVLQCAMNITSCTRDFFSKLGKLTLNNLLDQKKINYSYSKLFKTLLPSAIPLLSSITVLFSQKSCLKNSCYSVVYKYATWKRDEYYIIQNKRLIELTYQIGLLCGKTELLNINLLPYHTTDSQFPLCIYHESFPFPKENAGYIFHYASRPLAMAHKDLIGPMTFDWDVANRELIQLEFLKLGLQNLKNDIIEHCIAEQAGSPKPISLYQTAKELWAIERKMLKLSAPVINKLDKIVVLQKKHKEIVLRCPQYIHIEPAYSFTPNITGLKTIEAQEFYMRFSSTGDFISHIHGEALQALLLTATLETNEELAWLTSLYLSIQEVQYAIKDFIAFKIPYLQMHKNISYTINRLAKKIQPEQMLYLLIPFTTCSPLIFWYANQLQQTPFVDLDQALEKEGDLIRITIKALKEAIREPDRICDGLHTTWKPFFLLIDQEYENMKEELLPSIKEKYSQLVPNLNQEEDEKEPSELEKEWQEEILYEQKKWRSQFTELPPKIKKSTSSYRKSKTKTISTNTVDDICPLPPTENRLCIEELKTNPLLEATIHWIENPPPLRWTTYVQKWMTLDIEESKKQFEYKYLASDFEQNEQGIWNSYFHKEQAKHAFSLFVDSLKLDPSYCHQEDMIENQNFLAQNARHRFLFGWLETDGYGQYVTFHFISRLSKGINNRLLEGRVFHRYANHLHGENGRFHIAKGIKNKLFKCEEKDLVHQLDQTDPYFTLENEGNLLSLFPSGFVEIQDKKNSMRILLFPLKAIDEEEKKECVEYRI